MVYKEFPQGSRGVAYQELVWLRAIGTRVAPEVLGSTDTGYFMEELAPARRHPSLPAGVVGLLNTSVWPRSGLRGVAGVDASGWVGAVERIFGVGVPDYVVASTETTRRYSDEACCHGDPTFGNVLVGADQGYRLIDPCHRSHAPESPLVDLAKVVQSCLGWETVHADAEPVDFVLPEHPLLDDERPLRAVVWWTGMHAARIRRRELSSLRRPGVLEWSERVQHDCFRAAGLG